jgi:hypothetical protein
MQNLNRRRVVKEEALALKGELAAEPEAVTRPHELSRRVLTMTEPLLEERQRAEAALRVSEERFRLLVVAGE